MTTTPPEAPSGPPPNAPGGDSGPRVDRDQVRDLGRMRRSVTDRKVAGVAGGMARHLDIDPLILRVAFVVLIFFGGAGLILYGACWLLVPDEGATRAPFNLDERSRSVALIIVGVIAALALIGDSWGAFWFPWPLAIVALVAVWLLTRNSTARNQAAAPPAATQPPPQSVGEGAATDQMSAYAPPPPIYYAPPVRQPNPRKRGPILFWFTLALIAVAEGILGITDLAGADVAGPAYPALAVGISGVMLLLGAFWGRAGGIILIGLLSAVALAGATIADHWDGDRIRETPRTAASVDSHYSFGAGDIVLDLREVADPANLDGRTIELDGNVGQIKVIVPNDLAATIDADIDGPGNIRIFNDEHGGIDINKHTSVGSAADPEITIDAQLSVGQIEVTSR